MNSNLKKKDKVNLDQTIYSKERELNRPINFFARFYIFQIGKWTASIISFCLLLSYLLMFFRGYSTGYTIIPILITGIIWLIVLVNKIKGKMIALQGELDITKDQKIALDKRFQELQEISKNILKELSLPNIPNDEEIDRMEREIDEQIENMSKWNSSKVLIREILRYSERVVRMKKSIDDHSLLALELCKRRGMEFSINEEVEESVNRFFELITEETKSRDKKAKLDERLVDEKKKLKRFKDEYAELKEEFDTIKNKENELKNEWMTWLEKNNFDPHLSQKSVDDALNTIKICRKDIESLNVIIKDLNELDKNINEYIELAKKVSEEFRNDVSIDEIPTKVKFIGDELKKAEKIFNGKEQKNESIKGHEKEIDDWKLELSENNKNLQEFIKRNGASDENDLKSRFEISRTRKEMDAKLKNLKSNICKISGVEEFDEIESQLKDLDKEGIVARIAGLKLEIDQAKKDFDALQDTKHNLKVEIRQLGTEDELGRLYVHLEGLKHELKENVKKFLRFNIASYFIKQAKEKDEKRQPDRIKDAEKFFNLFTKSKEFPEGRYEKIIPSLGQTGVSVVDTRENRIEPKKLSRGTAEQLYLALRFGCIKEKSKHSESIPIIMDDILVNFDPLRANNACKAIIEFSKEHQVLFFTCHPEIRDSFLKIDSDINIISLD